MSRYPNWADKLKLRDEVVASGGQIADLQMSLYSAVYTDRDVPYQDSEYFSDITEPTPSLVGFMAAVARRLGKTSYTGKALFHLDQGMGGGKSHALVGLYHLARQPERFFATELGSKVRVEAEQLGNLDLADCHVLVLSADNMTPGATSPEFGPATTLYERFLWALTKGDKAAYHRHQEEGPNKAALARALEAAGGPVLVLLDELMDYVMLLSDQAYLPSMPGEKAFLNNLMDAVDEVPQVAFVVVMIRSDLDDRGYTVEADDFRSYVASRLERNGITVAVTEAQDFSAIIRRRLFDRAEDLPIEAISEEWRGSADETWRSQVFDRLGAARGLATFGDRLAASYPFHPDLMTLVREDWSRHAGFQRVRSTVEIFAVTAHYWIAEHAVARWVPDLIGVGDIPLSLAVEHVLSSGLLHGNERAIQGFRQVAATDVVSRDGSNGRARELDLSLGERGVDIGQPRPAERVATALFAYSLVPRAQAKRGATKPELLAAVYGPGTPFQAAEEVFNLLTSDDEGLGALETISGGGTGATTRYQLAIAQTLRMFFRQAKASVQPEDRDVYVWERAKDVSSRHPGPFDQVIPITRPDADATPLSEVFGDVDQNGKTRLVVLDPRRWTLLNGKDTSTRSDISRLLGVGDSALPVDNAASCVVVCVNTQRRDAVRRRATDALAWKALLDQLEPDDEKRAEAQSELRTAADRVDADLQKAFQHFAYLVRTDKVEVEWARFDDDTRTSLKGNHVWDAMVENGRATRPGSLSGSYLETLLGRLHRDLTLKEIVQQFFKNPAFPLVSNAEDIRRAIFESLSAGYAVVSGDGEPLGIGDIDELALGSMDQTLRPAREPTQITLEPAGLAGTTRTDTAGTESRRGQGTEYRRYLLEVPNRSLIDPDVRRAVANLLQALLDAVDPDVGGDLQMIDVKVDLTAASEAVGDLSERARESEARWEEGNLDF